MDRFESVPQVSLLAAIVGCLPEDLPQNQTCATRKEADDYFSKVAITITYLHNYIDYEIVKDKPVDQVLKVFETVDVDPYKDQNQMIKFEETRVELMDKLW